MTYKDELDEDELDTEKSFNIGVRSTLENSKPLSEEFEKILSDN